MMRTTLFIMLMFCLSVAGYAQKGKVTNRNVERNKNVDNKKGYNYFLLDMVKDIDVVYTDYEALVQRVWDKKVNLDLRKSSADPIKKLDRIKQTILDMPVFKGGIEYQEAVLAYIDVMKKKIVALEKFGVLGADANSDFNEYKNSQIKFEELTNEEIDARNIVRRKKGEYEKTVFMD